MGSLPPVQGATTPVAAAAALPSDAMVLWLYVDDAQTHELQAGIRKSDPLEFFVRETERGNPNASEAHVWRYPIQGTWESRSHHLALEERLTLLGRYQRNSTGTQGWKRVQQNVGAKRLDLEALETGGEFGATRVHYYGSRESARSALILETPSYEAAGERVRVARLDFDFPHAETGTLSLVHKGLPPVLARSVLAALHLELAANKLEKVVSVDRNANANAAWWNQLAQVVRVGQRRLHEGQLGGGAPAPKMAPIPAVQSAPAPSEASLLDLHAALEHPRLLALHRRFVTPDEERNALAEGEGGIANLVRKKRAEHGADQQHLLGVLEASLLGRHHAGDPTRMPAPMAELLRRALAYL